MNKPELQWDHKVFNVKTKDFDTLALDIFRFQAEQNPVYKAYLQALEVDPSTITELKQVPFLPVRFFKSHAVQTTSFESAIVFESSGTTDTVNSRHRIKDVSLYENSFIKGFEYFYGAVNRWCIIGLLPSYLERKNASLVYMVDKLISLSEHPQSGFYLDEYEILGQVLSALEKKKEKTLLIGVSFALLDLAEKFPVPLKYTTIMETGGMKGRREEIVRAELHNRLKNAFSVSAIHSEYGMTELLSQAYSKGEGIFYCPPWMKLMIRDEEDPFVVSVPRFGTVTPISGVINVIDLANIYSCSFIATDDVGKIYADGGFEVLGRMDGSDLRGCSLMVV